MKKILVIDDEKDFRDLVEKICSKEFEVVSVGDAEEGFKIIKKNLTDLLLLDINLPRVGGYTLCQRIRADEQLKKLPIIMLTVRRRKEDQLKGLELGADDYITKPFEPKELIARIKTVLARCKNPNKCTE